MHYIIYQITNTVNGKIYIGKHQTDNLDDGYMGSGKVLIYAIEKYGIDKFEKKILHDFPSESEMNHAEAELVTEEFCKRDDTYNLCPGGQGGFGYIQNHPDRDRWNKKGRKATDTYLKEKYGVDNPSQIPEIRSKHKASLARRRLSGEKFGDPQGFKGKSHTDEWKSKQSEIMKRKQSGDSNSQFGSMWITNGVENKKINRLDKIPEGWYKGRKMK